MQLIFPEISWFQNKKSVNSIGGSNVSPVIAINVCIKFDVYQARMICIQDQILTSIFVRLCNITVKLKITLPEIAINAEFEFTNVR